MFVIWFVGVVRWVGVLVLLNCFKFLAMRLRGCFIVYIVRCVLVD